MDSGIRDALRSFTLEARRSLLAEAGELLEGIYGLLPSGSFAPERGYPALKALPEAAETRGRLEKFLADETAAGLPPKEAREKLAKEVAFTWLNRLVAFKVLETRKLIRQTVSKGPDSNGFKLWLTEAVNEAHRKHYEAGDLPQNALGEGPRQEAYRKYLLHQCGEIARGIRVLFDPENLPSRLFPRPRALKAVLDLLNAGELQEAWQPGNEETIGWVYQYFNAPDLEIFRGEDAPKVPPHLMSARTQQYTPRWIVRFLVENTLGRLWLQMHPGSGLRGSLEYLVHLSEDPPRLTPKSVKDITLLDPACVLVGSRNWPHCNSLQDLGRL